MDGCRDAEGGGGPVKLGIASALARIRDPEIRFAVVYNEHNWHPRQPPEGSEWDYMPYPELRFAEEAMTDMGPGMTDPELWVKREDGWHELKAAEA